MSLLLTQLGELIAAPFQQSEWTNPVRKPVARPDWVYDSPLQVLVDTTKLGRAPLSVQRRWTPQRDHTIHPNLLAGGLGQPAPTPFKHADWPNPVRHVRPDGTQLHGLDLATLSQRPFSRTDWPVPPRAKSPLADQIQNLLTSTLSAAQAKPFAQTEWPNPRGPHRPDGTQLHGLDLEALALNPYPFLQTEWPNPTLPVQRRQDWKLDALPGLLINTTEFARTPLVAPWSRRVVHDHSLIPNLLTDTLFTQEPPFAQLNWSNPIRVARREILGSAQAINLTTLSAPNVKPFLRSDWPNPTRAKFPSVSRDVPEYFAAFVPPPAPSTALWKPIWVPRRRT